MPLRITPAPRRRQADGIPMQTTPLVAMARRFARILLPALCLLAGAGYSAAAL